MIPPQFEYFAPETLDEAISLLEDHGPEASVLAGGQSLIPLMKLQLAFPAYVVDINRIAGLADISDDDCCLRIGSLTRESDLDRSEAVQTKYPILHDTTSVIADPLVRNMATVGGNLAHGDPANDHPATMLALGAEVVAVGSAGERIIPVSDFFEGPLATALEPGRNPHGNQGTGTAGGQWRRISEAGAESWRLRHCRRSRRDHRVRRGVPASGDRPDQRRPDTGQGQFRRVFPGG